MVPKGWRFALATAVLALIGLTAAQTRPADRPANVPRLPGQSVGLRVDKDLEYAQVDGRPLRLDVYTPQVKPSKPLPLIVWVHGGAWTTGSKERCPAVGFVAKGYVVASINYRLCDEAKFPAQIEDCKAAIRWLRANAARFQIDPQRVGAWGDSAGGHLVALLGTSGGVKELEGSLGNADQSSRVQAVVDFFGPTNFEAMTEFFKAQGVTSVNDEGSPLSRLIGGAVLKNRDKAMAASPTHYVTKDDPPFLIVHGDRDPLVPLQQSEMLAELLKKAGVPVTLYVVRGAGHGFGANSVVERMVETFFQKHLKGPPPASQPSTAREKRP
jgi:acetyl esterase/lipase